MTFSWPADQDTASSDLVVARGHGTRNDFVIVPDPRGVVDLKDSEIAALCDRRSGVGGDGLIRVARRDDKTRTWWMDYRNADGSTAGMCGNGVRVFAEYLWRTGLLSLSEADHGFPVWTESGLKTVCRVPVPGETDMTDAHWWLVGMGAATLPGGAHAAERGTDTEVGLHGLDGVIRPGLLVDVGNPHVVVALAHESELEAVDLSVAPVVSPEVPGGVNVEVVVVSSMSPDMGHIDMRVFERGVGETQSCGTGACAAVKAAITWAGGDVPPTWLVNIPGGAVHVTVRSDGEVDLAGPAELICSARVDRNGLGG